MSTHHAFFCSDVVSGIASYLPTADVLSLVMCGSSILTKVLHLYVDRCLVYTIRDAKVFYKFLDRFTNTKYVYVRYDNIEIPKSMYKLPNNIKRFVAPRIIIYGFSFGSHIQYISVYGMSGCKFSTLPEICILNLVQPYNDYVTHICTSAEYSIARLDDNLEGRYPRLMEIDIGGCPLSPDILVSETIKITYRCRSMLCEMCGARSDVVATNPLKSYSEFSGAKTLCINGIIDENTCHTIPSSVTSISMFGKRISSDVACGILTRLPDTIIDISLVVYELTEDILMSFNNNVDKVYIRIVSNKNPAVHVVSSNCRKIQFSRLTIDFDGTRAQLPNKALRMLTGHYCINKVSGKCIEFQRIRARN